MRGVTSRGEPRPLHAIIFTRTPHAGSDGDTIDDVMAVVAHSPCGSDERALKLDPGN